MGSMQCHCGCGMHNSDGLNSIELSLYKLDDVNDAISKGVLLKDQGFYYKEHEVWRCPECGRWNFIDETYNYRMCPAENPTSEMSSLAEDDVLFVEHDITSADNAYSIDSDISVRKFMNLKDNVVRLRFLRLNSKRMLVYRDASMNNVIKVYIQEK